MRQQRQQEPSPAGWRRESGPRRCWRQRRQGSGWVMCCTWAAPGQQRSTAVVVVQQALAHRLAAGSQLQEHMLAVHAMHWQLSL